MKEDYSEINWLEISFGEVIEESSEGMTLKELVEDTDYSSSMISQIRNGRRRLTPEIASQLSEKVGRSESEVLIDSSRKALKKQRNKYSSIIGGNVNIGEDYINNLFDDLMRGLEENDIYWLISIEPPIEFSEEGFERAAIEGAESGAKIRYVSLPDPSDEESSDTFTENISGLDEFRTLEHAYSVGREFKTWKRGIIEDKGKSIANNFSHHVVNPETGMLLMSPFVKYVLIERSDDRRPDEAWADVSYISSTLSESGKRTEQRASLKLKPESMKVLKKWCREEAVEKERV